MPLLSGWRTCSDYPPGRPGLRPDHGARRMPEPRPAKIAYLVNQYPQTSHTFIRREIAAIETTGLEVDRYTMRPVTDPAVDEADEAERARTRAILGVGPLRLLAAATRAAV